MKQYLEENCSCGKIHTAAVEAVVTGSGVVAKLPEFIRKYGAQRPFLLADVNTWAAAGEKVAAVLETAGIAYGKYVFPQTSLEPDERAVGAAVMHFDSRCDLVIGIGSGVINDIGKILSNTARCHYIIVATAPSMDGYASATSSMSMDGLKVSLSSRCADVIIGDTDILREAPMHMLSSGIGDMLAKYVSIAEWRIAHLLIGEYYCEAVAQLIRGAVKKCVDGAEGLLRREPAAVEAVFEGLVIGGLAMAYAGVSRPASGVEHYFSHVWDMRGLEFGTDVELHGIQCATATLTAVRLYELLQTMTPDKDRAAACVEAFSFEDWSAQLRTFLGSGAEAMIAQEAREGKYNKLTHAARFAAIERHWQDIGQILQQELPPAAQLEQLLELLDIPTTPAGLGVDGETLKMTFRATKDIRDKYVLSRLAWDMGVLDSLCDALA